ERIEACVIGAPVVDELERRCRAADRPGNFLTRVRDRPQRQVPLESDAQFALDAEPAEIAESDTRSGPVNAPLENSPDDRLVESAHPLHAQRGQPDLVADRFAFGGSHEPYELI